MHLMFATCFCQICPCGGKNGVITDANPISIPTSKLLNSKGRAASTLEDIPASLLRVKFWPKQARGLSQTKNTQLRNFVYNLCNVAFVKTKKGKICNVPKSGVSVEQLRDLSGTAKTLLESAPLHPLSLLKKEATKSSNIKSISHLQNNKIIRIITYFSTNAIPK